MVGLCDQSRTHGRNAVSRLAPVEATTAHESPRPCSGSGSSSGSGSRLRPFPPPHADLQELIDRRGRGSSPRARAVGHADDGSMQPACGSGEKPCYVEEPAGAAYACTPERGLGSPLAV